MDWAYILLTVFLVFWALQMIFEHLRKMDRLRAEIREAVTVQAQVSGEAEEEEESLKDLHEKLKELETRAEELKTQEKALQERVAEMKRKHGR